MGISLVTFASQTVTPQDDALVYEAAVKQSGMIYGGAITLSSANVLHIAAGHGIICGRKFTIDATDVSVTLTASDTLLGRLYIHMDLSDTDEPISLEVETASTLTDEVQESDVNINNGVYEIRLAEFTVDTSTISDLVDVTPFVSNGIDAELDTTSSNTVYNSAISTALGTPEEIGGTASKGYSSGDLVLGNSGQLYEASEDITSGDSLTEDGNITATDGIVDQISQLNSNLTKYPDYTTMTASSYSITSTSYTTLLTADDNYWLRLCIKTNATSGGSCALRINGVWVHSIAYSSIAIQDSVFLPVKKGDVVTAYNDTSNRTATIIIYKFNTI